MECDPPVNTGAIPKVTDDQDKGIEIIRVNHDEAYLYVSQGLTYEEEGKTELAKDMYDKGLQKINKALEVRCDRSFCVGQNWDSARNMQHKMRRTSKMIQTQLEKLNTPQSKKKPFVPPHPMERPPSYEESLNHENVDSETNCASAPPNVFSAGSCSNGHILRDEVNSEEIIRSTSLDSLEVEEAFSIPGGVQLFFVSGEGAVSAPSYPSSLFIYKFKSNRSDVPTPAWLQVDTWTYPLIPGQSPVLQSSYGAYMFPDVLAESAGSAVGIILPPDLDITVRKLFEKLLADLTSPKDEQREEIISDSDVDHDRERRLSENISSALVSGAEKLSFGLVKGAEITSSFLHKGAAALKNKTSQELRPVTIDPRVQQGVRIARTATGAAMKVSGFLVDKLGEMTTSVAKHMAPYLRQQSSKLVSAAFKSDEVDSEKKIDNVLTVAAGGVQGFSTVYMGLVTAARTLADSLIHETVEVVSHKYGTDAGEVTDNAMNAVGNLALTTHNISSLGVKSIAKKTAKDTGKEVLKDYLNESKP